MKISSLFARGDTWSIALHRQTTFEPLRLINPFKVFNSKNFWRGPVGINLRADPFLIVNNNELFIFFEAKAPYRDGWIEGYRTKNMVDFDPLGVVLREPYHLSYPFVFKI